MKIVFFRHSLLSRGGDKMVLAHAGHLAACGHQVVMASSGVNTVLAIPNDVSIEMLCSRGKLGTIIYAFTKGIEAEVIVADIITLSLLLFIRNSGRVLYYAQDYDESYYTSHFMKGMIRFFYFVGLRLLRIPTIAVSKPLAELLGKRFKARVEVAENGVDTKVFYPDPDPELVKAKEGLRAILLLSRSDRRKGFDIARDVINSLSKSHSGAFEVWTVGEPCTGIFTEVVHRDFGYVAEDKLRKVMSSADMFFYPTRHEGLPLMPIEALACGCPVVTTTAVPYGCEDYSMRISAVGDAKSMRQILAAYIDDDDLYSEFRKQRKDIVKRYDLTVCEERFAHLIENIGTRYADRD